MKTVLLSLLMFLSPLIYSQQNLLELYKNNFPAEYYSDNENKNFLEINLQKLSSTRPDLVYYFSEVITAYSISRDTSAFREGMRFISFLTREVEAEHNDWIKNEVKMIPALKMEPSLEQKEIEMFPDVTPGNEKALQEIPCPFSIDQNKKNYFSLIYYTNNAELKYDKSIDYRPKVIIAEKNIINNYRDTEKLKSENVTGSDLPRGVQGLFKYWYLFKESNPANEQHVRVYQVLANRVNNEYSYSPDFYRFQINAGFSANGTVAIKYSIDRQPILNPIEYNNSFSTQQFSFGISYRYQLKPVRSMFSFLYTGISYQSFGPSKSKIQDLNTTYVYSETSGQERTDYTDQITSPGAEINLNHLSTILFQVSTPIFFPFRNIALELGVTGGINFIDYSFSYSYHYKRSAVRTFADGSQTTFNLAEGDVNHPVESGSRTQLIVRPIVKLNFDFLQNVSISALGSFDYGSVFMAYSF